MRLAALLIVALIASSSGSFAVDQMPTARRVDAAPDSTASDWIALREAYETARLTARRVPDGFAARNLRQRWDATFDARGLSIQPDAGGWNWGLELQSYGFARAMRELPDRPRLRADGPVVVRAWDASLDEWYRNERRGLEHGFTIRERPPGQTDRAEPLVLTLALRGALRPVAHADGLGIRFVDDAGATVLDYSGLVVTDATGAAVPARLECDDASIRLTMTESDALYPLTVDPVVQQEYIKATNTNGSDWFGFSVAISGDTAVVGALLEDSGAVSVNGNQNSNSVADSGAAYVFVRSGATWTQQAYLKPSNTGAGDSYGYRVAISGNTVAVGAPAEDCNTTGINGFQFNNSKADAGAVYVYVRNGVNWSQQAYVKPSNTDTGDRFGSSVSISGNTLVVGAPNEDSNATGVGGNHSDNNAPDAGAAYVFLRTGNTWAQQAYLKASNTETLDNFGTSVSIDGETVVVGASGEDSIATGVGGNEASNGALASGAAYVFVRSGTTWSQQAYLKASNTGTSDLFGSVVAASGDTVAVSALEGSNATGINGNQNDNSAASAGAAYVFVRSGTTWSQQAYIKASNTELGDNFVNLSLAGDILVVGAWMEDSNATGVDGNQTNNGASGSGAAYVFVRSGSTWTQRAYLKASNAELDDHFGSSSTAVSGDKVVIGAPQEDSNAFGVNGNQADNSAIDAGAAYVFQVPCNGIVAYDSGCPGTGGIVPELRVSGCPDIGSNVRIEISKGQPNMPALLALGTVRINAAAGFGCNLLVGPQPAATMYFVALDANGGMAFEGVVTAASAKVTTMQAFMVDLGTVAAFANSNAVEITIP